MSIIADDAAPVKSTDTHALSEAWWAGFNYGSDGELANVPEGYTPEEAEEFQAGHWSGFDNYQTEMLSAPTPEEDAEWLGFTLGADGVLAELLTPDDAERDAFDRGHDAGDTHLWTVDPMFASHIKEMSERATLTTIGGGL